jgi:endonuclease/exonuclease/phosphatase family metal-dependent hydrolase
MRESSLTVATFNLRVAAGPREPAQAWLVRRPLVRDSIRQFAPDLLGTQEGLFAQLQDLRVDLPEYRFVGQGRDGGSQGEFAAIFYREDRFVPLETGHFWLSDFPDQVASSTWGTRYRRMATWARLSDRQAQRDLIVLNTHWDHEVPIAREKSAWLIRERLARWPAELPVVVTGDFNAAAGHELSYDLLVRDGFLRDTWTTAVEHNGDPELNSFNDFGAPQRKGRRIDWVLTRGPLHTASVEVIDNRAAGQYPSDHFPVMTRLTYR